MMWGWMREKGERTGHHKSPILGLKRMSLTCPSYLETIYRRNYLIIFVGYGVFKFCFQNYMDIYLPEYNINNHLSNQVRKIKKPISGLFHMHDVR